MDRRTVLAVTLSLAIYYGWLMWRGPTEPPVEPGAEGAPAATTEAPAEPEPGVVPAPAPVEEGPATVVPFAACGVTATVSTNGGRVADVTYPGEVGPYHVTPLYTWVWGRITGAIEGSWKPFGDPPGPAKILTEGAAALVAGAGPSSSGVPMSVVGATATSVELSGRTADGLEIRRTVAEHREGDACWIGVDTTWTNVGATPWKGDLWLSVHDHTSAHHSRYQSQHQPMALVDGDVYYGGALGAGCVRRGTQLSDTSGPIPLEGPVSWFGISDRYFGFFVVPQNPEGGTLALTRVGAGDTALDGAMMLMPSELAVGASRAESFRVFAGQNRTTDLAAVAETLPRAVDLGWFAFFGYPLLLLLRLLEGVVGNWGVAIILLTFLVKLAFFPMTQKSFVSMQKMQQIQPELNRIREAYADNPQEMNRLTLELMSKNQVNPLSGCLPTLVQMPVFIALYNVLLTSVELYHTQFLYLRDLTSPDPYLVLPLSITFLMWLQQQMTTPPPNVDPAQRAVLKWMPVVFGVFFFASPSGLGVYFFVNMFLSILQQWYIKRSLGPSQPPAPAAAGT